MLLNIMTSFLTPLLIFSARESPMTDEPTSTLKLIRLFIFDPSALLSYLSWFLRLDALISMPPEYISQMSFPSATGLATACLVIFDVTFCGD